MKRLKKLIAFIMALAVFLSLCCVAASAKTIPDGQTVGTVLFYITNSKGERILVSQIPVSEMESDMKSGKINATNHNYSLLDRYVTTVHQEAQGFTVPEFVAYAQSKSTLNSLRGSSLTFAGKDMIRFWEIDQTGFDDMDTYTYDDLYGVARYNFPLLYQYWNYRTQDYYDPAGKMTRDQVMDYIFQHGEPETVLLSVRAFSQRYMVTDNKYGTGDYNMENSWLSSGLLDNERAIRVMMPMTKDELLNKTSTASDSRYWVANLLLDMDKAPSIASLGSVAAPTATMTEDADNYYIRFQCATGGATILYNQNYISPSYTPTCQYSGEAAAIPKSRFPSGTVTMTCRAVKDGCTDAGVVTLNLTSSGTGPVWQNPYSDVASGSWYYDSVKFITTKGLFDPTTATTFSPNMPMTRAMLATALYRLAGKPGNSGSLKTPFTDVPASAGYADAVAWAYQAGVINGTGATTFDPDASITREQITAMFWRYASNVAKADTTAKNDLTAFTDRGGVSGWAAAYMRWAVGASLINGTSKTTLTPQGTATRAQVAAMVQRFVNYLA